MADNGGKRQSAEGKRFPQMCVSLFHVYVSGSLKTLDIQNIVELVVVAELWHHVGEGGVLA